MPRTPFLWMPLVLALVAPCYSQQNQNQTQQPGSPATAASGKERTSTVNPKGRILGIGGIFFKSANREEMRKWYGEHLGLVDKGGGAMLPWREKDKPENEHLTVWSVFAGDTKYFEPSQASFMVNYIVDDIDALLDRLKQAGVKIDPKRQDESYGRFAWIYDPDGNKIELWQPLPAKE